MNILDIRTILIGFVVSDVICALVVGYLWFQHRRKFPGLHLWAADFIMQIVSIILIALRGIVPDFLSMIAGNALNVAGSVLLLTGLELYLGNKRANVHNWGMVAAFTAVHGYFSVVHPSLTARNVNMAAALVFICAQCAWLLLRRAEPRFRKSSRYAGVVFVLYLLVSVASIVNSLFAAKGNDFLNAGLFDAVTLLADQMLFISLTFSLFLMVNSRLSETLDEDIAMHMRTELRLRLSEEKFSVVFQSVPDALTLTSIEDGRILDLNENFSRLFGHSRDEAVGRTTIDLKLWRDNADRAKFIGELLPQGHAYDREVELLKKSGESVTGLVSGKILNLQQGVCLLSVIHDVTEQRKLEKEVALDRARLIEEIAERKKAEESLRASETFLREAQAMGRIGNWSIDAAALNYAWSDEMYAIHGVAPGLPISHDDYQKIIHPGDRGRVLEAMRAGILDAQRQFVIDYRILRPDGSERFVTLVGKTISDGQGRLVSVHGTVQDITERIEQERQIKHLASFPTLNANPVIEIGIDGSVRYANAAAMAALAEQGVGSDFRLFLPGTPDELIRLRSQCVEKPLAQEFQIGDATFLRNVNAPSEDALRVYAVDITKRVRLEKEVRALNAELDLRVRQRTAELSAANKELEAFSYSVSHDLRSPLRSIDGFSHAFLEDFGDKIPQEGLEYLDRIRNASQRMGRLIDNMLLLSRLTRSQLYMQETDISSLSAEVAEELAQGNPRPGVEVSIEPGMKVVCDQQLLRIVLTNLLGNAWKFTSKRENAHIAVGTVDDPERGHAFFVRDDGAGFDAAYTSKLFTAFERLHGQQEYPGIGVGLATVQRAIRRHGGEVWAIGQVDRGATFFFTIPVLPISEPQEEKRA